MVYYNRLLLGLTQLVPVSSLPQEPPAPIGPVVSESVPLIFPEGVSAETYNTQYLQKHSNSAPAILAAAKVAGEVLRAPREEVEGVVFTALGEGVQLDISVRWHELSESTLPNSKTP